MKADGSEESTTRGSPAKMMTSDIREPERQEARLANCTPAATAAAHIFNLVDLCSANMGLISPCRSRNSLA